MRRRPRPRRPGARPQPGTAAPRLLDGFGERRERRRPPRPRPRPGRRWAGRRSAPVAGETGASAEATASQRLRSRDAVDPGDAQCGPGSTGASGSGNSSPPRARAACAAARGGRSLRLDQPVVAVATAIDDVDLARLRRCRKTKKSWPISSSWSTASSGLIGSIANCFVLTISGSLLVGTTGHRRRAQAVRACGARARAAAASPGSAPPAARACRRAGRSRRACRSTPPARAAPALSSRSSPRRRGCRRSRGSSRPRARARPRRVGELPLELAQLLLGVAANRVADLDVLALHLKLASVPPSTAAVARTDESDVRTARANVTTSTRRAPPSAGADAAAETVAPLV